MVEKNSNHNENKKKRQSKLGPFSGRSMEIKRIEKKKPFVQCKEVNGVSVEFFRSFECFNAIVMVVAVGAHEIILACWLNRLQKANRDIYVSHEHERHE